MKPNELSQLVAELKNADSVVNYQELIRSELKTSWFRRAIIEPIIRPLIERLLKDYLEIIVRALIKILIEKRKL